MKNLIIAIFAGLFSLSAFAGEIPEAFKPFVGKYRNLGGRCKLDDIVNISYEAVRTNPEDEEQRGEHSILIQSPSFRTLTMAEYAIHDGARFAFSTLIVTPFAIEHDLHTNVSSAWVKLIIDQETPNQLRLVSRGSRYLGYPTCNNMLRKTAD